MDCPICGKEYQSSEIENHVNKCLFLNDISKNTPCTNSGLEFSPGSTKRPNPSLLSNKKKVSNVKKSIEPSAKRGKYIIQSSNEEDEREDVNESSLSVVSKTINNEEIFKTSNATTVRKRKIYKILIFLILL